MSKTQVPQDWDPLDQAVLDDPHGAYEKLRRECPVAHSNQWKGFWSLSRYEEICTAASDARTFINSVQNVVPHVGFGKRVPLHADPPIHTFYRRTLNPPFQAQHIEAFEPTVRELVVDLLKPIIARGHGEFVQEFAYTFPVRSFCRFMNMSEDNAAKLKDHAERYAKSLETSDYETLKTESEALYTYARNLVGLRKVEPLNVETDVTSALIAARMDGEAIPDDVIIGCIRQLLVAGHITLTLFIATAVWYLAKHSELQSKLRQQTESIPAAIEELLRLFSPTQAFARTTTRDVEINGRCISQGDVVALIWISGNRDETVFPNPHEFNLERKRNPHLAFGHGVHKCLGAPLARMEIRVVLEELLARTQNFALLEELEPENTWPEYGVRELKLKIE